MVLLRRICGRHLFSNLISGYASSSTHFLKYVPDVKSAATGGVPDFDSLNKKVLLLYFSAEWCATCKEFTPKLKTFYNSTKDDVAILWISRDKSKEEQQDYYQKGLDPNWLFVPLGKTVRDFLKLYKLSGLPSVKLLDKDGHLVEEEVKKQIEESVMANSEAQLIQKWKKQLNI